MGKGTLTLVILTQTISEEITMENKEQLIEMNERVRITARISRKTRALAKGIYPVMGVSLEERIEFC